ncbi:hypothetical protein SAMN05443633_101159 [Chryseobacterium arachidis]|uniref:Uncharacterized protein n=1 Tax=Chryseobacterium arachidis TaxID=1416778 RepID=A0A1M4T588_9FLAO|nr:hypothetical protein [Chryseobacterium arachidis]SHE39692.1 hypothetical protein SAMN05443633_101159 [Chryseobacterium arachidis]
MSDLFFLCFVAGLVLFAVGKCIYFFIEKKKIVASCKLPASIELKNISGTIFTDAGRNKRFEQCFFHILINENSIFLFSIGFSFIPNKVTNLLFSNSNRTNTRKPTLLREYKIDHQSIEFVYYPEYLMNRHKKITLKNLNQEQISIFENLLDGKSRRFY